jgi:pilus assembly protein CpaC
MTGWRVLFALLGMLTMGVVCAEEATEMGSPVEIRMHAGDTQVIEGGGISEVAIGNSAVVSASDIRGRGILLTAREPGETTLRVWQNGKQKVYSVFVRAENLLRLQQELRSLIGDIPGLRLVLAGNTLMVDGDEVAVADRRKIGRVLTAYPGVINLLEAGGQEGDPMIYMDVRIIELSRNGISSLGVDWSNDMAGPVWAAAGDIHKSVGFQTGMLSEATGLPATARVSPFQSYFGMATRLDSRINLLEQSGDALMVAHPILSCRNQGKASFLSGGQIPFASASATGTPSVEFKDYGIKLDIAPVLGGQNSIFAKISAEVSDLDKATTVNEAPGLLTRKTETEFTMKLGETIVLSGLVNKTAGKEENAVPGLGKLPFLGRLFGSRSRHNRRNELVIFVTPMAQETVGSAMAVVSREGARLVRNETRDATLVSPLMQPGDQTVEGEALEAKTTGPKP